MKTKKISVAISLIQYYIKRAKKTLDVTPNLQVSRTMVICKNCQARKALKNLKHEWLFVHAGCLCIPLIPYLTYIDLMKIVGTKDTVGIS